MTNAEKFLKDGTATEELIGEMETSLSVPYYEVAQFWNKTVKPTLTEDEKTILRSMALPAQKFMLYRNFTGGLVLRDKDKVIHYGFFVYDKLFQFIKERRRILY